LCVAREFDHQMQSPNKMKILGRKLPNRDLRHWKMISTRKDG
jgi:hypothetical protein